MGIELGVWITGTTEHVCHMAISAFLTDNFGRICIGLPNIGLGSLKIKKKNVIEFQILSLLVL